MTCIKKYMNFLYYKRRISLTNYIKKTTRWLECICQKKVPLKKQIDNDKIRVPYFLPPGCRWAGDFQKSTGGWPFREGLQNLEGGLKILLRMYWRNFQKLSKDCIHFSFLSIIVAFMATLVVFSMYSYKM